MITIYKNERTKMENGGQLILVELRGLSTDEKPITFEGNRIDNGSSFIEINTGKVFLYDLTSQTWKEI